jgi:hypothetical protein
MPTWAYWGLFFLVSALAIALAKRLDDGERRRHPSSSPPSEPPRERPRRDGARDQT